MAEDAGHSEAEFAREFDRRGSGEQGPPRDEVHTEIMHHEGG
jgi:hypothetical protein